MNHLAELDENYIYSIAAIDINRLIALKEKEYMCLKDKFELLYNTFVNSLRHNKC